MHPSSPNYVRIFDTTLRDGEQSPGASLTSPQKIIIAHRLADLGVDIIEAGFPAASPDDFEAVRQIARELKSRGPIIAGLSRLHRGDIQRAFESVRESDRPRIHTFIATSDLHLEKKLQMSRTQVVDRVYQLVGYARDLCHDVEFSAEDAGRSDPAYLVEVLSAAVAAGATTLNIPDTVGYNLPEEIFERISYLIATTPHSEEVVWSVHCHDDLGLATANTLAGLRAGARQAEVTINGIGERAGNSSLEELVMALRTRPKATGLDTGIDSTKLIATSREVSRLTGISVPPNKAVVGRNAFAHEAGIHQDGMLKDQRTYEIMTPESVGLTGSDLVLGKHSGRHAFSKRLEHFNIRLSDEEMDVAFKAFKKEADHKKVICDHDLLRIAGLPAPRERFGIIDLALVCQPGLSTATVRLSNEKGEEQRAEARGSGSVSALFRAIERATEVAVRLLDYQIHSMEPGVSAVGEVSVRIASPQNEEKSFVGSARDSNIFVASAMAYLVAIHHLLEAQPNDEISPHEETHDRQIDTDYTWGI